MIASDSVIIYCALCSYEHAWFEVDSIFGQRFGPTFPDTLRSCDITCECGNYPTTTGGLYPEGIDLVTTNGQQVSLYLTKYNRTVHISFYFILYTVVIPI